MKISVNIFLHSCDRKLRNIMLGVFTHGKGIPTPVMFGYDWEMI